MTTLGRNLRLLAALAVAPLATGAAATGVGCAHSQVAPPAKSVPPTKPPVEAGAETGIPVASSPQGLLEDGAEKRLQDRLRAKGFLDAKVSSGTLDADTRDALRRFQKHEGLPPTGLPSYETAHHLGLALDTIFVTTHHPKDPSAAR